MSAHWHDGERNAKLSFIAKAGDEFHVALGEIAVFSRLELWARVAEIGKPLRVPKSGSYVVVVASDRAKFSLARPATRKGKT